MLCSVLAVEASKLKKKWIAACSSLGIFIAVWIASILGENAMNHNRRAVSITKQQS
jgi:hypothetical protein